MTGIIAILLCCCLNMRNDTAKAAEKKNEDRRVAIRPLQETVYRDAEGYALYQAEEVQIQLTAAAKSGIHTIRWAIETDEKKLHTVELPVYVLPTPEPTPESTPEPTAAPEATTTPEPTTTPESTPEPTTAPEPIPTVTPMPTATSTPTAMPDLTVEPTPTAVPTPTAEPTPTAVPTSTPAPQGEVPPEPGDKVSGWTVEKVDGVLVTEMSRVVRVKKEMNDIRIRLEMTDHAGGSTEKKTYCFSIDRTAPEVKIQYDENRSEDGMFFKSGRTAEITVKDRNFDPELVSVEVTRDGRQLLAGESAGNIVWTTGKHADMHTAYVQFSEDGVYDFSVRAADRVGLVCDTPVFAFGTAAPTHFVVDRTAPLVRVSYDNNNAEGGMYFKTPRIAHVTIAEQNFVPENVRIGTGAGVVTPKWKSDGRMHTAEISFTADGSYHLSIQVTDRAGNPADEFSAGGAAAPETFIIDQRIESLKISGVKDGVFYRRDVQIEIAAVDQNYASCNVRLFRTWMDEQERDVTAEIFGKIEEAKQGWTGSGRIRAVNPEQDGLYELQVVLQDLAGNEKTESISFVVNRHGSIYQYDSLLKALQGTCVRRVLQPLIITEYNPSPLQGEGKIEVTRDGRPVQQIKAEIQSGRLRKGKTAGAGWYQYRYLLRPETFLEEGTYRIGITGRDQAGNLMATERSSGGPVFFSVDRTPPSVDRIYIDKIRPDGTAMLYLEVFDSIGLSRVTAHQGRDTLMECESFPDSFRLRTEIPVTLTESEQIRIVMLDMAGNASIERVRPEILTSEIWTSAADDTKPENEQEAAPEETEERYKEESEPDERPVRIYRGAIGTDRDPGITGAGRSKQEDTGRQTDFRFGWLCILLAVTVFSFGLIRKYYGLPSCAKSEDSDVKLDK